MTKTTLADPKAVAQYLALYGGEVELFEEVRIPAHPNDGELAGWVVNHPVSKSLPTDVSGPTYQIIDGGMVQSVWLLSVPMGPRQGDKGVNAWWMVAGMLAGALDGEIQTEAVNPLMVAEHVHWTGKRHDLGILKSELHKAGFHKFRFFEEARRRGGQAMTEAQNEARRQNAVKATEAAARAAAKARLPKAAEVVTLAHNEGVGAVARVYNIKEESAARKVRRAEQTLSVEDLAAINF